MSIYLSESHRMLKADFQRPGRYFGWTYPDFHPELLYLTYFTKDFLTVTKDTDNPVVRDSSIPLIRNNFSSATTHEVGTLGDTHVGLPSSFNGLDYIGIKFRAYTGTRNYYDTVDMPWSLPFSGSDRWSVTFRAYYPTGQSVTVHYDDASDIDTYYLNPSVSVLGNYSESDGYTHFGSGDFRNGAYPHKVLSTYKQAQEDDPKYWPDDFQGTTLYNGTVYGTYNDPGWPSGGTYPPAGRMFYSFGNDQIQQENSDQWYYTVIVGHGDGTISTYVNGQRILNVPFESITHLEFYVGAKRFGATIDSVGSLQFMQVTEVSLWRGDLSYNDRMNVPLKTQPIYKKENGIYVPNEMY